MKIQSGHALNQFFAVIFYFTLRHKICPIETPRMSSRVFKCIWKCFRNGFHRGIKDGKWGTSKIRVEIRSETDSNWW